MLLARESGGARTLDPRLKRPLLYQLSYRFKFLNSFLSNSSKTYKIRDFFFEIN